MDIVLGVVLVQDPVVELCQEGPLPGPQQAQHPVLEPLDVEHDVDVPFWGEFIDKRAKRAYS